MIIHIFLYWNWKEKKVKQCSPTITWTSTKRSTHNSSDKNNHLYDQWSSRSRVPTEFWNWGYNCCFFLNFVPLHIDSPYNFGGTGPILGVKNPLQRVNGHAADRAWNRHVCFDIFCFVPFRYIRFVKLHSLPVFVYISFCFVSVNFVTFHFVLLW